jgi:hypothetical protein
MSEIPRDTLGGIMAKRKHSNAGIGPDNWLYIGADALSLFAEEGGALAIRQSESGITIELLGVTLEDHRLPESFRELANSAVRVDSEES